MAAASRVAAGPRCFLLPKSHAALHSCNSRSATSSPALCRSLLPSSSSKPLLKPSSNAIRHSLFCGQSENLFLKGCSRSSRIQASGDAYSGNSIVWPTAELQLPYAREVEQQERPPGLVDLDPQNMLLRQRIVFLGGQVDDNSADAIISQLLLLNASDSTTDIKMFINSPGGSVTAGMGIYDAMQICNCDISTICFGLAASMGAFLLSSGTKGKRYAMPNARIMIHQPLGGGRGSAIDFAIQAQEIIYHRDNLNRVLSLNTGKPASQIEIDCDRDNFMDPIEAKEYGLIDDVIDVPGVVAPEWVLAEPPKTKINEYWTVRKRKDIRVSAKKDRKRITRST